MKRDLNGINPVFDKNIENLYDKFQRLIERKQFKKYPAITRDTVMSLIVQLWLDIRVTTYYLKFAHCPLTEESHKELVAEMVEKFTPKESSCFSTFLSFEQMRENEPEREEIEAECTDAEGKLIGILQKLVNTVKANLDDVKSVCKSDAQHGIIDALAKIEDTEFDERPCLILENHVELVHGIQKIGYLYAYTHTV